RPALRLGLAGYADHAVLEADAATTESSLDCAAHPFHPRDQLVQLPELRHRQRPPPLRQRHLRPEPVEERSDLVQREPRLLRDTEYVQHPEHDRVVSSAAVHPTNGR